MAKKKFTELPAVTTPLDGTEIIAVVQDGVSKKATVDDLPTGGNLQSVVDAGSTAVLPTDLQIGVGAGLTEVHLFGDTMLAEFNNDRITLGVGATLEDARIRIDRASQYIELLTNSVVRFYTNGNNNEYQVASTGSHRFLSPNAGAEIRLYEEPGSGSLYIALKAPTNVTSTQTYTFPAAGPASNGQVLASQTDGTLSWATPAPKVIQVAASDETTALTTGTKVTFRMPYAMTLTAVRASLTTAQASGSIFTVDIQEAGVTVLSTLITIDNTEETSTTATTPPVISDAALADDAEITIIITQIGTSGAAGLKVSLIGS